MIVIGIAGGVASGKSLVASCFGSLGATILDGDRIGHEVLQQPELIQQIVKRWGGGTLNDGKIDRAFLARIVFAPPPEGPIALAELEQLTHPKIGDEIKTRLERARNDPDCQACILDAPVMFKVGWDSLCDKLVFVDVPYCVRLERARERGWSDEELAKRESNQTSVHEKRAKATDFIDNTGSLEETFRLAQQLWLEWGLCLPRELPELTVKGRATMTNQDSRNNGTYGDRARNQRDGRYRGHNRSSYNFDQEVTEKLREIESSGEPLSIAETISREFGGRLRSDDPALQATAGDGQQNNVTDLQRLNVPELLDLANSEGVHDLDPTKDYSKPELVLAILKQWVKSRGIMFGQGTLQILPDGFGFLRSPAYQYLSCPDDIYVSPSQIRKFNLGNGAVVCGQVRPPKENERYFALLRVESINGIDPSESAQRSNFEELTPLHPDQRIAMEHDAKEMSTRVIDMLTPIGFGQRGLIVSPPRAGKTMLMQKMARATLANYPNAYVMMLLIDERPEEVTDMQREVQGERCEVISSTFDEPASRHIQVADIVLEKAKRLVESGTDVVIFLDSITRLGRAWNAECPQSGKTLSGGLDANALQKPKSFFGSARKLEEGGSLTILATALIATGSKMDDVIFEEFKGTGNLEIVLDRSLVDKRIWPAIDINASGTRREEKLFEEDEYDRICHLRRVLSEKNPPDAMDQLTTRLKKTKTNAEFLMSIKTNKDTF